MARTGQPVGRPPDLEPPDTSLPDCQVILRGKTTVWNHEPERHRKLRVLAKLLKEFCGDDIQVVVVPEGNVSARRTYDLPPGSADIVELVMQNAGGSTAYALGQLVYRRRGRPWNDELSAVAAQRTRMLLRLLMHELRVLRRYDGRGEPIYFLVTDRRAGAFPTTRAAALVEQRHATMDEADKVFEKDATS